jgi:hypothetical protein
MRLVVVFFATWGLFFAIFMLGYFIAKGSC